MKYSYPFLIYNVNAFRTHNEGNRPFVEENQNQTLALIEKMLKMFSVRSIDEANLDDNIRALLKNSTFDTKNYLETCPDALPANCEYKSYSYLIIVFDAFLALLSVKTNQRTKFIQVLCDRLRRVRQKMHPCRLVDIST